MDLKDDSHIKYVTYVVRPHRQLPRMETPAEYVGEQTMEFEATESEARRCRGRSVKHVVLLGLTEADLPAEMRQAMINTMRTHESFTGIKPTFIEVGVQNEPA